MQCPETQLRINFFSLEKKTTKYCIYTVWIWMPMFDESLHFEISWDRKKVIFSDAHQDIVKENQIFDTKTKIQTIPFIRFRTNLSLYFFSRIFSKIVQILEKKKTSYLIFYTCFSEKCPICEMIAFENCDVTFTLKWTPRE